MSLESYLSLPQLFHVFSPLCVLWACACACLSDLCVFDPTHLFFHLMALSHLRILIYSQTLWGSLKLIFLFYTSHTDCGLKIRPCLFWFFLCFLCFCRVVKEEITDDNAKLPCYNGRVICWVRTETHIHTSHPALHLNSLVLLA